MLTACRLVLFRQRGRAKRSSRGKDCPYFF